MKLPKCTEEAKESVFFGYNDLVECATTKNVRCRIIDYTPLLKDYMEES